jgi:hypothetical protein
MELTDKQKRDAINEAITRHYPKMLQDEKRITSYNSENWNDLLSFCLTDLLTKKSLDYIYELTVVNNKLPNYMGRSMSLNLKSKTSPYWFQIRKYTYNTRGSYIVDYDEFDKHEHFELSDPDLTLEQLNPHECMLAALEKIDFYHRQLVTDFYLNGMTYKDIHKKYGITINSVRRDIKQGIQLIQQHCSHFVPNKK